MLWGFKFQCLVKKIQMLFIYLILPNIIANIVISKVPNCTSNNCNLNYALVQTSIGTTCINIQRIVYKLVSPATIERRISAPTVHAQHVTCDLPHRTCDLRFRPTASFTPCSFMSSNISVKKIFHHSLTIQYV